VSVAAHASYQESGIPWFGVVPSHWTLTRFKQVFLERHERSTDGLEELLSVSAYTGVTPRSEIIAHGDHLSRSESLEGYRICGPGDLVMNIMLAWNRGLGVAKHHGIVSPAYSVFRVQGQNDPRFLDYLVRSENCTGYFKAFSTGVMDSRLRLYPDVFGGLGCALPPPSEQRAIAAFLDQETGKIDALVEAQRRLIELLKQKRQAVISRAVTKGLDPTAPMKDSGVEWLGEVPEHWALPKIKWRARVFSGTDQKSDSGQFQLFGANGGIGVCESASFERSLVLIGRVGSAGAINLAEVPFGVSDNALVVDQDAEMLTSYLYRAVGLIDFGAVISTTAQPLLTASSVKDFKLPVPPISEQSAIAHWIDCKVTTADSLVSEAEAAIGLLQERRTALISAAVTGKIDVRGLFVRETEAA
jgi:type I restriction enzyme, S subunit